MQYVWLIWSLLILLLWGIIFVYKKPIRAEMLKVSLRTMPMGLSEPLFVPEYWTPPSMFNLAAQTGFDIESLIFSFAIGGIGAVLYKVITPVTTISVSDHDRKHKRHRFHLLSLFAPPVVFLILALFTPLNHIYCGSVAMFAGGVSAMICRADLTRKIWISGLLFTGLYFIYFTSLNIVFPDYVEHVWTLEKLSGVVITGIPLEEYLFAFTFGMYWSSLYEHLTWRWRRLNPA
ncbi:MAG: hypothetical protein CL666_13925 [Balneola sp.]|nr:hypothetical protein [Balneola sp.]